MKKSEGSIAVEALLLIPALFIFATAIVFYGRFTDAKGSVHQAADVGARVASQSSERSAVDRARIAALLSMNSEDNACRTPVVTVEKTRSQREVHYVVRVNCTVNLQGLGLLSLGRRTVSATSSEVVDVYTNR